MVGVRRRKSTSTSSGTKKPRQKGPLDLAWKSKSGKDNEEDEHLESSSDEDEDGFADRARGGASSSSEDDEEDETVDAKRVRMAREYLQKLEAQQTRDSSSDDDDEESDDDAGNQYDMTDRISARLQKERMQKEGTLEQELAHKVQQNLQSCAEWTAQDWMSHNYIRSLRGHDLTPTCVAMPVSGEFCVSGSKDNSVLLYDVERATKTWTLEPQWKHTDMKYRRNDGEVLSVACSDDGRYAVVGKRDATVDIHDLRLASNNQTTPTSGSGSVVNTFKGHKGPVTALTFRSQSLQLFSASQDRCIRHYNLDEMMYMETLYGHQAAITQLDCHTKERPLSVGRDRTARAWKLSEDTHLIFRGGARWYPAECCTVLKDDWFVTGHEASMQKDASAGSGGTLALWLTEKKKPVTTLEDAHPSGITSLACVKGSDLVLSGSNDGLLKLWSVQTGKTSESRGMESIGQIPIHGFINDIAVGPKAQFCVAAVGQEPRLGRWERVAKAKNRIVIIQLRGGQQQEEEDHDDTDSVEEEEEEETQQQQAEEESSNESSGSQEDESEDSSSENESE